MIHVQTTSSGGFTNHTISMLACEPTCCAPRKILALQAPQPGLFQGGLDFICRCCAGHGTNALRPPHHPTVSLCCCTDSSKYFFVFKLQSGTLKSKSIFRNWVFILRNAICICINKEGMWMTKSLIMNFRITTSFHIYKDPIWFFRVKAPLDSTWNDF